MSSKAMKIVKGVTAGLAVGSLVGYMGRNMMQDKKHIKKKASKAMSNMADTVECMFK